MSRTGGWPDCCTACFLPHLASPQRCQTGSMLSDLLLLLPEKGLKCLKIGTPGWSVQSDMECPVGINIQIWACIWFLG